MKSWLVIFLICMGFPVHALELPFDLSAAAPFAQSIDEERADQTYELILQAIATQPRNDIDLLNAAEFKRQIALFEARGYHVDPKRSSLALFKGAGGLELYYTVVLLNPADPPSATVLVPRLRARIFVFTRCAERCEVSSFYLAEVDMFWGNLPWDKGGNSSSGGTVRPP